MRDVTDDLAGTLFALDAGELTTRAVTALIIRWAQAAGWSVRTEARVFAGADASDNGRLGFIDVVVRRAHDGPDLAIEIDSGDKPWSVHKLRHASRAGMRAIWVRWGDDEWAGIHDDVDVIQLRAVRRPSRLLPTPQVTLW